MRGEFKNNPALMQTRCFGKREHARGFENRPLRQGSHKATQPMEHIP